MSLTVSSCSGSRSSGLSNFSSMDLETYLGSTVFLKTIVPFALATVVARRCEISQKYLRRHSVASVPYVGFRSTVPAGHCARFLHSAERKIQAVVEKKYLKVICLYIQNRATKEVLEMFEFTFTYLSDDDRRWPFAFSPLLCNSNDSNVGRKMKQKDTRALLVAGNFFTDLNQIPNDNRYKEDEINLQFELQFYRSMTEPELNEFETNDIGYKCNYKIEQITSISTRYHRLDIRMRRRPKERKTLSSSSSRSIASKSSTRTIRFSDHTGDTYNVIEVNSSKSRSSLADSYYKDLDDWNSNFEQTLVEEVYKCFCTINCPIGAVDGIQCKSCKYFEHVPCIGYMKKASIPQAEEHRCVSCLIGAKQWKDKLMTKRYEDEPRRKYFCISRLYLVCNARQCPEYLTELVSDSDRAIVETFLRKKKIMIDAGSKAAASVYVKYFYDYKHTTLIKQQFDSTTRSIES